MNHSELKDFLHSIESDIRNQNFIKALATISEVRELTGIDTEFDDLYRNQSCLALMRIEVGIK